jgi:hypothetical protein
MREDNLQYALSVSKIIHEPDRRIATFGETRFEFQIISELMDSVGQVRIRSGDMEATKPTIIRPNPEMELDGFNDEAREKLSNLLEMFRDRGEQLAFLQYGFRFRRSDVKEELVTDSLENVADRLKEEVRKNGNPMLAIIEGVDDVWEVSLMKFAVDMILQSASINTFDFMRKKLL